MPITVSHKPIHHPNPSAPSFTQNTQPGGKSAAPPKSPHDADFSPRPSEHQDLPEHFQFLNDNRHLAGDHSAHDHHGGPGQNVTYHVNDNGHNIKINAPKNTHVEVYHFDGPAEGPGHGFQTIFNKPSHHNADYHGHDDVHQFHPDHAHAEEMKHMQAQQHLHQIGHPDDEHQLEQHPGAMGRGEDGEDPEGAEKKGKGMGIMKPLLIGGGVIAALAAILPMFGGSSGSPLGQPPGGGGGIGYPNLPTG